ncbi:viral aspartic protease [Cereibacter changlensis]|uniref:Viral aspartic protease n=1 Tax=Cereibacter changlensis TaxID=402884 RepID=A0A4U0YXK9_9RHOB|nr:viral aspartic protease [Cereibacter changlensis]TKA97570.1 viral aspartic protease [Cereibacter changlensis]
MTPLPPSSRLRPAALTLPLLLALAACGGGGGSEPVREPTLERYTTNHNGFSRVRLNKASNRADDRVLAQFDDGNPASPAGYRNLIAEQEEVYRDKMFVEVIGQVENNGQIETVSRILRITADTEPFTNIESATGKYYFRGANYAWVSLDGGEVLSGAADDGLVNMMVDFDNSEMTIDLVTGSGVRTALLVPESKPLPFDIATGQFGGAVSLQVWDPNSSDILEAQGTLIGNVGGNPAYVDNAHGLATSGLYTISGRDEATGRTVEADGVFFGVHEHLLGTPVLPD